MVKLISQFDNEKTEVSLATPTCGGCCCCCCCCLVSTIATGAISARSFGEMATKNFPEDRKKIRNTKILSFLWPIMGIIGFFTGLLLANNYFYYSSRILYYITLFVLPILIIAIYFRELYSLLNDKKIISKFITYFILWIILMFAEVLFTFAFLTTL